MAYGFAANCPDRSGSGRGTSVDRARWDHRRPALDDPVVVAAPEPADELDQLEQDEEREKTPGQEL
jgi:hypothetical protein